MPMITGGTNRQIKKTGILREALSAFFRISYHTTPDKRMNSRTMAEISQAEHSIGLSTNQQNVTKYGMTVIAQI